MFRRYQNEPWTDRKLQNVFASIPKSTQENQILPYQVPKCRTEKRTNTDRFERHRRQHNILY